MNQGPFSPAAERNKKPILEVLKDLLPGNAEVLEIGSGTGQHALYFCHDLPGISWQPTELKESVASLRHGLQAATGNIRPPVAINVQDPQWRLDKFDVLFTANTLHIMSWQAVCAFFYGAGRHLRAGGIAVIYGPFKYHGQHTADSNRTFDLELGRKAPQMGVRDVVDVRVVAQTAGLAMKEDIDMPVNNRILVFGKNGEPGNG